MNNKYIIILVIISILITVKPISANSESDLILSLTDEKGEIILEKEVDIGKEFIVTFIHSSELEPWHNIFEIGKNKEIILKKIMVPSTGPGVPSVLPEDENWSFKIAGGYFIYSNVNKKYKDLDFIVSDISPHYLIINGVGINLVELTKDWAHINFKIRRKK